MTVGTEAGKTNDGGPGARVFISYASPDRAQAMSVCTALEAGGAACWIAPRDVTPGALYADEIVGALNTARLVVLLLSESSVASPHVLREVERASAKRLAIITVRLDAAALTPSLEYFLSASHWLDASQDLDAVLPTLIEAVRRILSPGWAPSARAGADLPARGDLASLLGPGGAGPRSGRGRTRLVVAAAAGVLIVAALIGGRALLQSRPGAATGTGDGAATTVAAAPVNDHAIAVMPFADMSERRDQEYFADGLSEELIDLLARLPDLRVAARTSSFYFKGKPATIADIARALGVAHVLEGSIRKSGSMLRVTAQLIRAKDGFHVWSETYDRKLDDIFKVQDDIAGAVVRSLKVSLINEASARSTPAANTEAYNQYLQGRFFGQLHTKDGIAKSIEYFQKATSLDPSYEPAWSGLAFSYSEASGSGLMPADKAIEGARGAAAAALKLDPRSPRAHVALGLIRMNEDWDWKGADHEFGEALAADPGNATVLVASGYLDLALGRTSQAATLFRQAVDRDPLHASSLSNLGVTYYAEGKLSDAEAAFRRSLELKPGAAYTHNGLALVLLARGDAEGARAQMLLESDESWRLQGLAIVEHARGHRAESDAALAELEQRYAADAPYQIATVHAYRGERDAAFAWLQKAFDTRDSTLASIKVDPLLKNITDDARYRALLKSLGLPY